MPEISDLNIEYCFGLRLADGQEWDITATDDIRQWTDKLIRTLELKPRPPNGNPRLIFVSESSIDNNVYNQLSRLDPDLRGQIPDHGWTPLDYRFFRLWVHDDTPDMIYECETDGDRKQATLRMWLAMIPLYERAMSTGGIPLHSALVVKDGRGFILAGSGGSGKTTCCNRLPSPWHALCDDETLVTYNSGNGYSAHPMPTWSEHLRRESDRSWDVERHAPLSAAFFLQQSDRDEAIPLMHGEAAVHFTQSSLQVCNKGWRKLGAESTKQRRKTLFDNSCRAAKHIPAYILKVKSDGKFWDLIDRVAEHVT